MKKKTGPIGPMQLQKSAKGEPFVYEYIHTNGDGCRIRWEIPAEDVPKIERCARTLGFQDITGMLKAYEAGRLPGQITDVNSRQFNILPKNGRVTVEGVPDARRERMLAECGKHWSQSLREFLRGAINDHARCCLAHCLVHPKTGAVLISDFYEYRSRLEVAA